MIRCKVWILMLPLLGIMVWVGYLALFLNTGREVTLPISGYDPRNLLSGHYVAYTIEWNRANCQQFNQGVCPQKAFKNRTKFYVPEKSAGTLDRMLTDQNSDVFVEIVYAYKKGHPPIAKRLLINGRDWQEHTR